VKNKNKIIPNVLSSELERALSSFADKILLSDDSLKLSGADISTLIAPIVRSIKASTSSGDVIGLALPHGVLQALTTIAIILSNRVPIVFKEKDTFEMISTKEMSLLITSSHDERFVSVCESDINYGVLKRISETSITLEFKIINNHETHSKLPPDVGMILYTSGSTGQACGIMIPAEGTVFLAQSLRAEFLLNSNTTSTIILPLSHTMCINTHFFPTILSGGNAYFAPSLSNLGTVYRNILESKGDNLALICDLLPYLHQERNLRGLPAAAHVKTLSLSGGMISDSDIEVASSLFPNARIYKGYGLTEATRIALSCIKDGERLFDGNNGYSLLEGVQIQIRDEENKLCKAGVEGAIFIKAKTLMKGHYNEETNVIDSQGYFKSGDIGMLSQEGRLFIHGRADGIIKINGERISAAHIEETVMSCEEIKKYYQDAVCLPIKTGNRHKAYLFLESIANSIPTSDWVTKKLKQDLKRRFKVPIEVVEKKCFPRSNTGKVLLKELCIL